jgi:hypothetical protein
MRCPTVTKQELNGLEGWAFRWLTPRPAERQAVNEAIRGLNADWRLGYTVGMTIAERIAEIDNRLAEAHLVLLDLASGHPVPADGPAVKAALADLETSREMLHDLATGTGEN